MPNTPLYIKCVGEGNADIGPIDGSEDFPTQGVIPTMVHFLCGKPDSMRIRRDRPPFLRVADRRRKVVLAKSQAMQEPRCAGVVYVVDTEGEDAESLRLEMAEARDSKYHDVPMAIGVIHPCLEAWLMADAAPIKKIFGLDSSPELPAKPEELPAPRSNRKHNPKTELVRCSGVQHRSDLSVEQKTQIAREIYVLDRIKERCPLSFAPFADEVEMYIKPLFAAPLS